MIIIKSFAINNEGDIIIEKSDIQMVENEELKRQTIQETIGTNKGEWPFDWELGIEFSNILGKGITDEMVEAEVESGLQQVDEKLSISEFSRKVKERQSSVFFKAADEENDTEIEVMKTWA